MKIDEAKIKFIQAWGALGSSWGVSRTMAQVHALLLISSESLSTEEIMKAINISRGNASMNVRALIDWGLIRKEYKLGQRKEYFVAEKDIWKVAIQVIKERRKRELAPILQVLQEVKEVENDQNDPQVQTFTETIDSLMKVVGNADRFMEFLVKTEKHWLINALLKLINRKD